GAVVELETGRNRERRDERRQWVPQPALCRAPGAVVHRRIQALTGAGCHSSPMSGPDSQDGPVIEGCVFDLDGVLVDSEPVWEQVRRQLVEERHGRWPPDAQSRLMGMSTAEWARYLSQDLSVGLPPAQVADLVVDRMVERYGQCLPLIPGAIEAVRRVASRWPIGLASSSPRRLIEAVLGEMGVAGLFAATVSTDEVGRG